MGHQCITNLNDEIETLKKWIKRVAQGEKYMKSVKIYKNLIYKICLTDAKALYEMVEVFCEEFVEECHQKIVSENDNIEKCLEIWNSYDTVAKQFKDIFAYLDLNYLESLRLKKSNWHQEDNAPENKKLSIYAMAIKMWTKTNLFSKKTISTRPLESGSITLAPIILANYCDQLLKSATKELINRDAFEEEMDVACNLYQYVDNKTLFNEIYGTNLAERIFSSLPPSVEAEKLTLKKLNILESHLKKIYLQHVKNFSLKPLEFKDIMEAQGHVKMVGICFFCRT